MNETLIGEFTLFYEQWKIVEVKKIGKNDLIYGETDWRINTIRIRAELSIDTKRLVLFHELVHVIFANGCYKKENDNEPLVEWLAKCLSELDSANIFNTYKLNGRE